MKTVSKLFTAAAIAFAAVACQVIDEGHIVTRQLEITATIAEDDESKVDYDIDNKNYVISPTWHYDKDKPGERDQIIGFDNLGNTFTFTVSGVSGNSKIATFSGSYVPPTGATTLYAIYAPGKIDTDFDGEGPAKTLSINLASQGGVLNGSAPVLMCATATIEDGKVNFQFTNQTAIIGVKQFKLNGVSSATTVTKMTLNGVVTEGTFSIDSKSGELTLTPTGSAASITAEGSWTTDDYGICATSVYFAAMPTTEADMTLEAATATATYDNLSSINKVDILAGHYYHMTKKLGHPVAAIGRERYDSINAAFEAADASTSACTITLLDHCSTSSTLYIQTSDKGAVTLDLNGKTLSCESNSYIYVSNNRSFKITDTSEDVADHGTIQIVGAMYVLQGNGTSTLTISGGKLSSPDKGIYVAPGANLTISGGEIESTNQCVYSYGTANISGGKFTSSATSGATIYMNGSAATGTISGGQFISNALQTVSTTNGGTAYVTGGIHSRAVQIKFAVDDNDNANEYVNILNPDNDTKAKYPFALGLASSYSAVASVTQGANSWKHATVEGAFINANHRAAVSSASSPMITQLGNATVSSTLDVNSGNVHSIILDLNNHTISNANNLSPLISAASAFTLTDSSSKGEGEVNTTGNVALSVTGGTTTISNGSLVGTTSAASVTGGTLTINGGHFYGGDSSDIDNNGGSVAISGGWFRNDPDNSFIATGYASKSGSETFKDRSYPYTVASNVIVATVNDTDNYTTLADAVDAVVGYTGDADAVELKLKADIEHNVALNLTHSTKPIVLDLNGHTLSTDETESFITTSGTLTIKDSGSPKGKITSKANNIISLTTAGANITLDGCIIESTAAASTENKDAAVYFYRTSPTNRPQLTIENGAQVYTKNGVTTIYSYGGKLVLNECEITSGTEGNGRYAIYTATYSQIIVGDGASIYSNNTSSFSAIHCGTNNNASITINGGYMYGNSALTAGSTNYCKPFIINGGIFNTDVNTISGYTSHTINNGFIGLCPETKHHTQKPTEDKLDYSYQYQSAVARIGYTGYASLADAVDAAKSGLTDATITLLTDITYDADATIILNNTITKIVTLDLYGHILTAGAEKFIRGTKFTITDTKGTGKIESKYNDIIYPNYAASVVKLEGCKIVSTLEKGSYYYSSRAVNCTNKCKLTITDGTVIEAEQTGIYCSGADSPQVTINSVKITSNGSYCIYVSSYGQVTVNGGTFHSAGYICGYIGNANATFTINHGYFSTGSGQALLYGGNDGPREKYTINGGYYSKALHNSISGYDTVEPLSSPVTIEGITYTHAHTSEN